MDLDTALPVSGLVAQSVEQRPFKPLVPGSSPGQPTTSKPNKILTNKGLSALPGCLSQFKGIKPKSKGKEIIGNHWQPLSALTLLPRRNVRAPVRHEAPPRESKPRVGLANEGETPCPAAWPSGEKVGCWPDTAWTHKRPTKTLALPC